MVEAHALFALEAADKQEQERHDHEHDQRQDRAAHHDVFQPDSPGLPDRTRTPCRLHRFGGHTRLP
jgi:hypothetical protein